MCPAFGVGSSLEELLHIRWPPRCKRRACSLALETVVDPHARPPTGRLLRVPSTRGSTPATRTKAPPFSAAPTSSVGEKKHRKPPRKTGTYRFSSFMEISFRRSTRRIAVFAAAVVDFCAPNRLLHDWQEQTERKPKPSKNTPDQCSARRTTPRKSRRSPCVGSLVCV